VRSPPRGHRTEYFSHALFRTGTKHDVVLIDPFLEETRSREVAHINANAVYSAHAQNQSTFIFAKFAQHIGRVNVIRIVIRDSMESSDVSHGPYRRSTSLLGDLHLV
jgi:hypothetical protein